MLLHSTPTASYTVIYIKSTFQITVMDMHLRNHLPIWVLLLFCTHLPAYSLRNLMVGLLSLRLNRVLHVPKYHDGEHG